MKTSFQKDPSLSEELPYWEFYETPHPHIVLNDGSLCAGMKVSLLDIECMDEIKINQTILKLRDFLNSLSEEISVQFHFSVKSDFSDVIEKHKGIKNNLTIHPLVKSIAEYRENSLMNAMKSEELYRPHLHVYLRTKCDPLKKLSFFNKKKTFSKISHESYSEALDSLNQNLESLITSFQTIELDCKRLEQKEHLSEVYMYLNPKRAKNEPAPELKTYLDSSIRDEWFKSDSPRSQLIFGDLILRGDDFTLDSTLHRVITLKTLPEITFAGQLSSFLRLPFHYDLFLNFDVPAQADEMNKLNQKRKMAHSLATTSGNKVSDLESETKLNSTEALIRELLSTGQRIYAAQIFIVLKEKDTEEGKIKLNRQTREVLSRFRSLQGAEGLEETVGAWKIFKGALPCAPLSLERAKKIKTNNLADFIPIYGPREGDATPSVLFRNRLNGLISYNPFDENLPNYNTLVTGSSGAGKSFLNNCILMQELASGLKVFIIDIGGSYKKLTESLNGEYLEINLSDQYRLNPFDIPNPNNEPSQDKIKSLSFIIESMVVEGEKEKLTRLDRALLEKNIIELYAEKRRHGKIPILSDLCEKLSKSGESSLINLSKILYLWTGDRPYGKLLDTLGTIRTNAPICTFDLKGLSKYPDLQSVMILILTDFILNQIESDKVSKKRIILDEAWQLLKSNAAANFMEYCARTLRKTYSGITFISQGVEEIESSQIGSAILNNTATKFVMLQTGDSEILKNTLKLNSHEIDLIYSLKQKKGQYSEGFMIEGNHRQIIRVFPSPLEYWISTSDPKDNQYLNELTENGLTKIESIYKAAELFPEGFKKAS